MDNFQSLTLECKSASQKSGVLKSTTFTCIKPSKEPLTRSESDKKASVPTEKQNKVIYANLSKINWDDPSVEDPTQ